MSTDNVTKLPGVRETVAEVLANAVRENDKTEPEEAIVVLHHEEKGVYVASNIGDPAKIIYLLEQLKLRILHHPENYR